MPVAKRCIPGRRWWAVTVGALLAGCAAVDAAERPGAPLPPAPQPTLAAVAPASVAPASVVVTPVAPPAVVPAPTPVAPASEPAPVIRPSARPSLDDGLAHLHAAFARIESGSSGQLGVYVRDLATGESVSHRADESWYLASMVKVPVAVAVLRAVDQGAISLATRVTLRASDLVDGAGETLVHPVGTALPVSWLLGQMIIRSDNTATDMLIGLVGQQAVRAVVADLAPQGIGPITTLAEVRRQIYGQLTARAEHLEGRQLLLLHQQPGDAARLRTLARETATPVAAFRLPQLDLAYDAYYRGGLNSGRLDAYADFLAAVVEGQALSASSTAVLLDLMQRVTTGARRIKAGLAPGMGFAHKTGTQRRRICDAGLITAASARPLLVVACVREVPVLLQAERMLQDVGGVLCRAQLAQRPLAQRAIAAATGDGQGSADGRRGDGKGDEARDGSTCLARLDGSQHPGGGTADGGGRGTAPGSTAP